MRIVAPHVTPLCDPPAVRCFRSSSLKTARSSLFAASRRLPAASCLYGDRPPGGRGAHSPGGIPQQRGPLSQSIRTRHGDATCVAALPRLVVEIFSTPDMTWMAQGPVRLDTNAAERVASADSRGSPERKRRAVGWRWSEVAREAIHFIPSLRKSRRSSRVPNPGGPSFVGKAESAG